MHQGPFCIQPLSSLRAAYFLVQVEFKDTSCDSFLKVLEYLYTGQCPSLCVDDIIDVMALANFFCLTRLVALCEQLIIKELQVAMATNEMAVAEDIIGKHEIVYFYLFKIYLHYPLGTGSSLVKYLMI